MVRPDRIPVPDALDIMPHAVTVDNGAAGRLRDREHAAIDMIRHAGNHAFWRRAQPPRPILAHEVMIGADPAGRDNHRRRLQLEFTDDIARTLETALHLGGRQKRAADTIDDAIGLRQLIDAVPEFERDEALSCPLLHASCKRRNDARTGPPGDMEPRHGIAMSDRVAATALRPTHNRKKSDAAFAQPRPLFAGRERNVGLGPFARPMVLVAIESCGAHPILQREFVGIANAHASLFG